jgi:hypothetical protein
MIIILGLIILVAAVVAGVAGVLGNGGGAPGLAHGFSVLGYHVTSSGTMFLYGCGCCWPGRAAHPAAVPQRGAGSGSPAARPPSPARRPPPSARTATT